MNLAFVQAPAWGRDCPPYTMSFLAALVRQEGHQAYLFDLNNALYFTSPLETRKVWDDKDYYSYWEDRDSVKALLQKNEKAVEFYVEKILSSGSRIIGFTVHFSSAWASLEIARRIKERDKSRIIIFGGPDCSLQQKGEYFIQQECVDIVVHGEGENVLFEIIKNVDNLKNIDSIVGCLILKNGKVVNGGLAQKIEDLDSLPMPDYSDFKDDINLRLYREPFRLDIFDSRGCINRCHFCSEWQFWGKFRTKSGERIFAEVKALRNNFPQVNYFYFIGSLLNGDMRSLETFCNLLIENKLEIRWAGQAIIRPEMTKDFLQKMKDAGCVWLGYGIESGSEHVLRRMNKRFSLGLASAVLEATKAVGIETQANFMFGLPTENIQDFNLTIDFLKNNRKNIDTILASQSFCVLDKGTYLYNNPEEFGIKNKEHHLYWNSNDGENNYPERLRRYEHFCQVALSLGVPETSGVLKIKPNKWSSLGDYYAHKNDYYKAIEHYEKARGLERNSINLFSKLSACYEEVGQKDMAEETMIKSFSLNSIQEDFFPSDKLAKALNFMDTIRYEGIDLVKLTDSFNFNDQQKAIVNILFSHQMWRKLSNYILAEVQKARREEVLFGYPYWLVLDPCNYCNLHCPFCPTGQRRGSREIRMLSLLDFKDVLDKLGPYLINLDLVNWGEPFLNKDLPEMIQYAKAFNINVKIDSNFSYLTKDLAEKIVLSGLDSIICSIDGLTPETYSKYRVGGDLNTAMDNLKLLIDARRALGKAKPFITWQFLVFKHNEHEIKKVQGMGKEIGVDHVGITKAFIGKKEWMPNNPEYCHYNKDKMKDGHSAEYFKKTQNKLCNWLWIAAAINSNGSLSACCSIENESDDFGNVFNIPFEEVWNGPKYRIARSSAGVDLLSADPSGNICTTCSHAGLINLDLNVRQHLFG